VEATMPFQLTSSGTTFSLVSSENFLSTFLPSFFVVLDFIVYFGFF
jgi:hypothetical protein